jgi:hypothetical protein
VVHKLKHFTGGGETGGVYLGVELRRLRRGRHTIQVTPVLEDGRRGPTSYVRVVVRRR